jgi:hypothetical protein
VRGEAYSHHKLRKESVCLTLSQLDSIDCFVQYISDHGHILNPDQRISPLGVNLVGLRLLLRQQKHNRWEMSRELEPYVSGHNNSNAYVYSWQMDWLINSIKFLKAFEDYHQVIVKRRDSYS